MPVKKELLKPIKGKYPVEGKMRQLYYYPPTGNLFYWGRDRYRLVCYVEFPCIGKVKHLREYYYTPLTDQQIKESYSKAFLQLHQNGGQEMDLGEDGRDLLDILKRNFKAALLPRK